MAAGAQVCGFGSRPDPEPGARNGAGMGFTFGPAIAALFMVVFARVGVLMMLMPALGERFVPARVRLALAIFLTLAMMPVVRPLLPAQALQGNAVFTTLFLELAIGL